MSAERLRPEPAWADRSGLIDLSGESVVAPPLVYQQVVDRIHRYCWGFDERRKDVLGDCFTDDAIWTANVMGETVVGPFEGREAVLVWLTRYWDEQRDQRRHVITNIVVSRVADDEATVLAYVLLLGSSEAASRLETVGLYQLGCRRENDRWRIARLTAGFDSPFWKHEVTEMSPSRRRLFGILED